MLYLIGYDARGAEEPSTCLRSELSDLEAERVNHSAWILDTKMPAPDLTQYLESFVGDGSLTVMDITDAEALAEARPAKAIVERTPGLVIGVDAMDHDHEHIFTLVRELRRSVDQGLPSPVVQGVLNVLLSAMRRHLNAEEHLMIASGYPRAEEHRAAHAVILEDLSTFRRLNAAALQTIEKCLRHHTATLDRDLAEHVTAEAAISA